MKNTSSDLIFGPGTSSGFTPAGIAAFDELHPAAVVRETLQNALDSAHEAKIKTAVVRFRLTRMYIREIPGIKSYVRAFKYACMSQRKLGKGKLPSQAENVVRTIKNALTQESIDVLTVVDNGIGLDKRRMTALLSDGVSAKEHDATGTYGNGHSVVIPASDLRYILYGGVTEGGRSIGAGHAVLASHTVEGERFPRAGDGFYVRGLLDGKNGDLYDYVTGRNIPELISKDLKVIKKNSGHGAVVVIPAFNHFREYEKTLWDMVSQSAACNFFEALLKRRLVVKVEDFRIRENRQSYVLDHITLSETLEESKKNKRSRAFLNGERAFEAHHVLRYGSNHSVKTSQGDIRVYIHTSRSGNTRIDLCRNGMWIADEYKIPGFYYKFKERAPFHAVLLLDSLNGMELHRLIRDAEGPLHNSIRIKNLNKVDQGKLRQALEEIRNWILSNTKEAESNSFNPSDYLNLDFGDGGKGSPGSSRSSFWGTPMVVENRVPDRRNIHSNTASLPNDPMSRKRSGRVNTERTRKSPVLHSFLQAVSVPISSNKRRILIDSKEGIENAELRLRIDENIDATCDRLRYDQIVPVFLSEASINGKLTDDSDLIRENGHAVGLRLGNILPGNLVQVEVKYKIDKGIGMIEGTTPSLRVDVFEAGIDTEATR